MAIHVVNEARRCLHCKKPMCREGCPIHTPIPDMIQMFLNNQMEQAGEMLFENNPLSIVCSLVCDHEKQCEGHCVRGIKGEPVHISSIENYISDACLERIDLKRAAAQGKRVAIVGSGPAGITIAVLLAQKGYDVTLFESRDKIGGVLRYGIPDFRLPNVHFAINYLQNPDVYDLGDDLVVIGAGNSAMDVARTALRKGVRHVTVFCRRLQAAASAREVDYALADGVEFLYGARPVEITDTAVRYQMASFDEAGNVTALSEVQSFPCSSVIVAVSQGPLDRIVSTTTGLATTDRGLLATDGEGHTTRPGVFASGDVVSGARTVVEAVKYSKEVARAMDEYLQTVS